MGISDTQAVARIPPNLGSTGWAKGQIRSYVRQRMAVTRQIIKGRTAEDRHATLVADTLLALELIRLGYGAGKIVKAWETIAPEKTDDAVRELRTQLRQWAREEKHGEEKEQEKEEEKEEDEEEERTVTDEGEE